MAQRELLNNQQRRLLRIAARTGASVGNLAPVLGMDEEEVRRIVGAG